MFFQYLLILSGTVAFLIDTYRSSETFYNLIGIKSSIFAGGLLAILFLIRLTNKYLPPIWFQKLSLFTFVSTFLIGSVLSTIEYLNYPNFVYSHLHLNYDIITKLSIFFLCVYLFGLKNSYYQNNYQKVIPLLTLTGLLYLIIARTWPQDYFLHLVKEDESVEYSQFFVLLACSYFSLLIIKTYQKVSLAKSIFFIILFLLFIFTAGDEISWGQRILGLDTPESVQEVNRQGEITVHNLRVIPEPLIWLGYLLVNVYGSFSHLLGRYKLLWPELIIPKFASISFLIPLFYSLISYPQEVTPLREWSEPVELFMYTGVLFYLFAVFTNSNKDKQ